MSDRDMAYSEQMARQIDRQQPLQSSLPPVLLRALA